MTSTENVRHMIFTSHVQKAGILTRNSHFLFPSQNEDTSTHLLIIIPWYITSPVIKKRKVSQELCCICLHISWAKFRNANLWRFCLWHSYKNSILCLGSSNVWYTSPKTFWHRVWLPCHRCQGHIGTNTWPTWHLLGLIVFREEWNVKIDLRIFWFLCCVNYHTALYRSISHMLYIIRNTVIRKETTIIKKGIPKKRNHWKITFI